MKPGADKALSKVFKQIGSPENHGFKPDPFQLDAVLAAGTGDCLVTAPTGAGKTWIAEQVTQKIIHSGGRVWYATPLKALTNSIHQRFSTLFGKDNVGILTGDIKENTQAAILIGTTEILRNQLYDVMNTGANLSCDMVILDEAHFLGDAQRGVVWEEVMIYLPVRVPLLLLSATIGNPEAIAGWLEKIRGKRCTIIKNMHRPVPLIPLFLHPSGTLFPLMNAMTGKKAGLHKKVAAHNKKTQKSFKYGRSAIPPVEEIIQVLDQYNLLPVIFFLKSRSDCDKALYSCTSLLLNRKKDQKKQLQQEMETITGQNVHLSTHYQRHKIEQTGAASHHSGHLPAWKMVVEKLMAKGLLNSMFATSTVAAGVNFPARSVVVVNSDRFNGVDFMPLTTSEYYQMTGRAGRRGMDKVGFAVILPGRYMNLDYIAHLQTRKPDDVESQIMINFSMVLNLLISNTPDQVRQLLDQSFASYCIQSGRKKAGKALKRFGSNLNELWIDFEEHVAFLEAHGFLNEDSTLTDDGNWASRLRMESPLLVAEALRLNVLPDSSPELIAAMMASFVNEKEYSDDPLFQQVLPKALKETFIELRKRLKPFAIELLDSEFDAPNLFIQPAVALYQWTLGMDWEDLVKTSGFAAGDLARLILRTAENLRQVANLETVFSKAALNAREAMHKILREPVIF